MAAENNTAAVTKSFLRVKGLYLEVLKSHRGLHERFVTLQTKHSQLAADFQALQCQTKGSKSLTEQHGVTEEVHTAYVQQQEVRGCLNCCLSFLYSTKVLCGFPCDTHSCFAKPSSVMTLRGVSCVLRVPCLRQLGTILQCMC